MSWIFGVTGIYSALDLEKFKSIHGPAKTTYKTENFYISIGGIPETCRKRLSDHSGWFVSGIGIQKSGDHFSIMPDDNWETILQQPSIDIGNIDGHFAGVNWNAEEIICFNDQLGLRDIYFTQADSYTAFSTRLDWMVKVNHQCDINLKEFGSSWLLQNQISTNSLINNVKRLGSGGTARIKHPMISVQNKRWVPKFENEDDGTTLVASLENLLTISPYPLKRISLGLSGGLDSRLLLSILLSSQEMNWCIHTFGNPVYPDSLIAQRITGDFKIEHTLIDESIFTQDKCISLLQKFIPSIGANIHASEVLHLNYHSELNDQNKLIIDGGFGEALRRQFLNRLAYRGRTNLLNYNAENIYPYLSYFKADIFNDDILKEMKSGAIEQIKELQKQMPVVNSIGIENWLDLLAVRTRLPNLYGAGQSCLDGIAMAFMPFAQPSILSTAFNLLVSKRKNGVYFKKIIRQKTKLLVNYPLVKSQTTYPFGFSTVSSWAWTGLKNKVGVKFTDSDQINFLNVLKEFIHDLLESSSVKNCELYNYSKIYTLVENYYKGNTTLASQLDWWLTFEIWRQSLTRVD